MTNLPTYDLKPASEATWATLSVAAGVLAGAIMTATGVDTGITAATVTVVTALVRVVGGIVLQLLSGKGVATPPPGP